MPPSLNIPSMSRMLFLDSSTLSIGCTLIGVPGSFYSLGRFFSRPADPPVRSASSGPQCLRWRPTQADRGTAPPLSRVGFTSLGSSDLYLLHGRHSVWYLSDASFM